MNTEKTTRWTALSALSLSLLSFGLSGWAVGCRDAEPPSNADTVAAVPRGNESARPSASAQSVTPVTVVAPTSPPLAPVSVPAATPTPPPTVPAALAMPDSSGLSVKRVAVTRKIERHEPVDQGPLAVSDAALYAFVELSNAGASEQNVVVTFEQRGAASAGYVKLRVPAATKRWRTWARTAGVRRRGEWVVVVRGEDGRELARQDFTLGDQVAK